VECDPCDQGGYCEAGAANTVPCPAGKYNNLTGVVDETGCKDCPAGTSCPAGTKSPDPCPPGSHTDESLPTLAEKRVCKKCEAGKYQDKPGATTCKECETGGYCLEGAASVLPCDGGEAEPDEPQP